MNSKFSFMTVLFGTLLLCSSEKSSAQTYFPPTDTEVWDSISPADLGWCEEKIPELKAFLDSTNTKSFIILYKGKRVMEYYFNDHDRQKPWYWASAGKTIMATLFGIAQEKNELDLSDPTTDYLGRGWTDMTSEQEDKITLENHLTMTCGFEYRNVIQDCTDPECLTYRADPGEQWYYHNAGYTLTHQILEAATGLSNNAYTQEHLSEKIGMGGQWLDNGQWGQLYWSDARSMARFGLLIANDGNWDNTNVLKDKEYIEEMINTSQDVNLSYGYLWWLNGKDSRYLPGLGFPINGPLSDAAPSDLYAGMGKNGQFVEVIPSMDLVVVRMGEAAGTGATGVRFHNDMWIALNKVICNTTSTQTVEEKRWKVYPNPVKDVIKIEDAESEGLPYMIFGTDGKRATMGRVNDHRISVDMLSPGIYFLKIRNRQIMRIIIQ